MIADGSRCRKLKNRAAVQSCLIRLRRAERAKVRLARKERGKQPTQRSRNEMVVNAFQFSYFNFKINHKKEQTQPVFKCTAADSAVYYISSPIF